MAAHDLVQQRRVEHGTSARSGLVERRGHRDHAVAGDAAIGGLDADRSGDRGRLADRTAGIGADRQRSLEGRQARRRTAARATRDPLQIPRIAGRTVGGGLGRGTHRKLVQIRLAEDHQAGGKQPVDDRGVVRRNPALQNARAGRRGQPLIAEEVFDPDRHSCQGAQLLAGRDPGVHRACLLQGALGIDGQEGVNVGVHLFDAIKTLAGDLFGALFPGGDPALELFMGQEMIMHAVDFARTRPPRGARNRKPEFGKPFAHPAADRRFADAARTGNYNGAAQFFHKSYPFFPFAVEAAEPPSASTALPLPAPAHSASQPGKFQPSGKFRHWRGLAA
ncbi:hypothetical protein SDC9_101013 [bioreactor metagenome]|uniref:Uncharacterized protein n=1 Tax=bioreactor metagenome TaxID=1076179 RepID=A0A645AN96_9ZZZZ